MSRLADNICVIAGNKDRGSAVDREFSIIVCVCAYWWIDAADARIGIIRIAIRNLWSILFPPFFALPIWMFRYCPLDIYNGKAGGGI